MSRPALPTLLPTLLRALADQPGLIACGLVDAETGMVCHCAGDGEHLALIEAASDYWRLAQRHGPVAHGALGPTRAQVLIHDRARLTLTRCGDGLLLVCISQEPDRVDWPRWKQALGPLLAAARQI